MTINNAASDFIFFFSSDLSHLINSCKPVKQGRRQVVAYIISLDDRWYSQPKSWQHFPVISTHTCCLANFEQDFFFIWAVTSYHFIIFTWKSRTWFCSHLPTIITSLAHLLQLNFSFYPSAVFSLCRTPFSSSQLPSPLLEMREMSELPWPAPVGQMEEEPPVREQGDLSP